MNSKEIVEVTLFRDSEEGTWGFGLDGGKQENAPLILSEIRPNSIADIVGLRVHDILALINENEAENLTLEEAAEIITAADVLTLKIERVSTASVNVDTSFEESTGSFSLKIAASGSAQVIQEGQGFMSIKKKRPPVVIKTDLVQDEEVQEKEMEEKDNTDIPDDQIQVEEPQSPIKSPEPNMRLKKKKKRTKITIKTELPSSKQVNPDAQKPKKFRNFKFLEEEKPVIKMSRPKPNKFKDWNCPWVQQDGQGLKDIVKNFQADTYVAPVTTSHHHFYSEPQSILDPPLSDEEVREMQRKFFEEQQRMIQMEKERREREIAEHERLVREVEEQERRFQEEKRRNLEMESREREKDNSHPRDAKERKVRFQEEESHQGNDDEEPMFSLEPVRNRAEEIIRQELEGEEELTRNIQDGVQRYKDEDDYYEPTANELIDVLKNLENLAASNPALYRAIVDQIKVNQPVGDGLDDSHGQGDVEEQQAADELQDSNFQQENESEDVYQETVRDTKTDECDRGEMMEENQPIFAEELRKIQDAKLPEVEPIPESLGTPKVGTAHPTQESQFQPNGNPPNHQQFSPALSQQQQLQQHQQQGLYPRPMPNYDYPWAGSLKPVSNEVFSRRNLSRKDDPGACPWMGSLRHIGNVRERRVTSNGKLQRTSLRDQGQQGPAWAGSLKHVKQPPRMPGNTKLQFKRYPEEDAPNPYQKRNGDSAAQIEGLNEKVEKIKNTLQENQTVTGALLRALMPKLLQVHESKYQPLEEFESVKIMEEILAMKIGLNPDQSVDDNMEAGEMIKAINQDEIQDSVYSQMADDLEKAVQQRRKYEYKGEIPVPSTPPPSPKNISPRTLEIEEEEEEF